MTSGSTGGREGGRSLKQRVKTAKRRTASSNQWLRRQLTPKQQSQILALGIPGIGFRPEKRRFYPGGSTASHIVGYVNIDNRAKKKADTA